MRMENINYTGHYWKKLNILSELELFLDNLVIIINTKYWIMVVFLFIEYHKTRNEDSFIHNN